MTRSFFALSTGSWNSEPDLDTSLVDGALRSGAFYPVTLYIRLLATIKSEQGLFAASEICADRVQWIGETYAYDFGRVIWLDLRTVNSIANRRFREALSEASPGIRLTDQAFFGPFKLRFFGYKAIAEALLGHTEAARLSVSEGEIVLSGLGRVSPWYLTPFSLGRLLTHIQLLKEAIQSAGRSDILQQQKNAYRVAKQAVRASRKYAPYRTWILRLMGDYYWLIGNQRKALKWWDKSIKEGERLGARPDLSRTYFEVGKRLLETQSKYKQLNGIDAKGYLEKAEKLFRELGLEHDLDELERIRLEM